MPLWILGGQRSKCFEVQSLGITASLSSLTSLRNICCSQEQVPMPTQNYSLHNCTRRMIVPLYCRKIIVLAFDPNPNWTTTAPLLLSKVTMPI